MIRAALALLLATWATACATRQPPAPPPPSGTVELNRTVTRALDLGAGGSGTLYLSGQPYRFVVGGLGTRGEEVSLLQTTGEAYHLADPAAFAGTYRPVPSPPDAAGFWLDNEHGVLLHLRRPAQGRLPALDGDGLRIALRP